MPIENARIFARCAFKPRSHHERKEKKIVATKLTEAGYHVSDLSDDEMAKLHVRYMVGGRPISHYKSVV